MLNFLMAVFFTVLFAGPAYSFDHNHYNMDSLELSRTSIVIKPIDNYEGDADPCALANQDIELLNKFGQAQLTSCEVSRKWFVFGDTKVRIQYSFENLKICFGSFGHILEKDLKILDVGCSGDDLVTAVLGTTRQDKNGNSYLPYGRYGTIKSCEGNSLCTELSILFDYVYSNVRSAINSQNVLLPNVNINRKHATMCLYSGLSEQNLTKKELCLDLLPFAEALNKEMRYKRIKSIAGQAAYDNIDRAIQCTFLPEDIQTLQERLNLKSEVMTNTVNEETSYDFKSHGIGPDYVVKLRPEVSDGTFKCSVNVFLSIIERIDGVSTYCDTDPSWNENSRGILHRGNRTIYRCHPEDIVDESAQDLKRMIEDILEKRTNK